MRHFPIFLDLTGKPVLVVGAGRIADAKAEQLARSGAVVRRADMFDDIGDAVLAVCADTGQGDGVANAARAAKIPVNVVDRPELCDFIWPSIVDRDPVTIAICTSGTSPVLARHLRTRIELAVPVAFGRLAEWAGGLRARIARAIPDLGARRAFWERILRGPAADLAMAGETHAAEREIDRALLGTFSDAGRIDVVTLPDAPDRLTLRDLRLLQNADVILHHAGIDIRFLDLARRDAERVAIDPRTVPAEFVHTGKQIVRLVAADAATRASDPAPSRSIQPRS
jgi:uroporphyrin-III C-methyltransferase/precorrin-2 dehydrogenase/sirohydrochlorin ferrochelatase